MSDLSSNLRALSPAIAEFSSMDRERLIEQLQEARAALARAEIAATINAETIATQQLSLREERAAFYAARYAARRKQTATLVWLFENFDDIVVNFDGRAVTLSHLFDMDQRKTLGLAVDMVVAQIASGRHVECRDFWPLCRNCNDPECSTGCDEHGKKYAQEAKFDLSKVIR